MSFNRLRMKGFRMQNHIRDKKMPCVVVRRSPMELAECLEGVELEDVPSLTDSGGVLQFAAKCWVTKEQFERIQEVIQRESPSHWMQGDPREIFLAGFRFACETILRDAVSPNFINPPEPG